MSIVNVLILRTLAGLVLIAGTWWSMAEVAWSSTLLQTHFVRAMSEPPVDPDLIVFDHVSECCEDFNRTRAMALLGTLLGGMPMAGMSVVLWRRHRNRLMTSIAEPFLLAALVFQFASMTLALLLFFVFVPYAANDPYTVPGDFRWMLFLLSIGLTSGMAIPVWYRLRQRVVPSEPPLNIV